MSPFASVRVRFSRGVSRRLFGAEVMLCALADWHHWRVRHLLNAVFLDREHCEATADWEGVARLSYEDAGFVDQARRAGWM